jgi:4-hydroxy-4-methyl-2-oxoglutarate aldolase
VKATAGAVNVPISIGGQLIRPGDTIIADDDGVLVSPRGDLEEAIAAAAARAAKEAAAREAFAKGELGLDRYGLRDRLPEFGISYVTAEEYERQGRHGVV